MDPIIYLLRDPRDGTAKYIGYTKNFGNRIHYHYRPPKDSSRRASCAAYPWLSELAELGMLPLPEILEKVMLGDDWAERERFWIAKLKSEGAELLNSTIGGPGQSTGGWSRASSEKRKKWSNNISISKKQEWENKTPDEKERLLENGARKGFKMMRPKTRDWRGRYNGAMDVPEELPS